MEKYNFMDHKFRASSFGDLMTGGKGISESQQKKVDKLEAQKIQPKKRTEKQEELLQKLIAKRTQPRELTKKEQDLYDKLTDQAEHTDKEMEIIENLEKKMNEVVGTTEKEEETIKDLEEKGTGVVGISESQQKELDELIDQRDNVRLSKGAKTYLRKLRREIKFKRRRDINSKYLVKGVHFEEEAITFLSVYHEDVFTNNKERREDDYFTGECDVEEGYDTKVSWSLNTLPDPEEPLKTIYEFQNRVYMRLWDRDKWTTSAIVMNMLEDQMKKEMYGEAWKWEDNEIPAWRKIEIIKLYIYEEDVFIKMCEDNDCLPNMEEYKRQLESEDEEVDPLLEKAAKMFMDFVEMPDHERIVEKTVERDMEIEENMVEIAKLSRQYMQDIEDEMYEKYLSNQ